VGLTETLGSASAGIGGEGFVNCSPAGGAVDWDRTVTGGAGLSLQICLQVLVAVLSSFAIALEKVSCGPRALQPYIYFSASCLISR
jgi:hypothetical protein